jgi:putative ABC transport system permease protein
VIRGRAFTDGDDTTSALVAIVSESAARRLWPGEDPMGKRIRLRGATRESLAGGSDWRTVIGVAKDTHLRTVRDVSSIVYLPYLQGYWQGYIAIRSTVPLTALLPALRRAGHDADPQTELFNPKTMDQLLAVPLSNPRLGALLMSTFGLVALLLAAIGLYGVMAALVRDQTREIGIRIALGATGARVRAEVLRRAAVVTGSGAIAGLVVALATSRILDSLLFQVSPTDPIALGGACAVLLIVSAFAAYLPARCATRIDPARALRAD